MSPDSFPGAFYINLDDRPERRSQTEAELARIGLQAERFPAVHLSDSGEIGLRRLACKLSHLGVIEQAQKRNMPSVLVLEDDIAFAPDFLPQATQVVGDAADVPWDLLYFGYESYGYDHGKLMPVSTRLARTQSMYLTHCYVVHSRFFAAYIDFVLRSRVCDAIDSVFVHNGSRLRAYCSIPKLAWQRPGFSDIDEIELPSGRA